MTTITAGPGARPMLLAALAAIALLALAACDQPERETRRVQVIENGAVLGELDRQPAVEDVGRRVGFRLQLPTFLPDNALRLVSLEAILPASGIEATGSDGRSNASAVATWASGGAPALRLQQFDRRVELAGDFERADSGDPAAELYVAREVGEVLQAAWLLPDRTHIALLAAGAGASPDDLARMFRSLR